MPVEVVSGVDVLKRRNRFSKYPKPSIDPERYIPYPTVFHAPKFSISPEDKIFTIGSCFARNIEKSLSRLEVSVLSALIEGVEPSANITNKYNTRSIIHDLNVAFNSPHNAHQTIISIDDANTYNLSFGGTGAETPNSRVDVENLTQRYYDNLRKLKDTDVVVITLGLAEVWRDTRTGVFLNIAPKGSILKADPERFEVHVLSVDDVVNDLDEIFSMLRRECRPGVRFLLTVSPVPLHATFRDQDVLQANTYSKSVQRTAVEQIALQSHDIAYFPSFEMVTLAAPNRAWVKADFRHVQPQLVDRIMTSVMTAYYPQGYIPPSYEVLRSLIAKGLHSDVISLIRAHMTARSYRDVNQTLPHIRYCYADAVLALGDVSQGKQILRSLIADFPQHRLALTRLDRLDKPFQTAILTTLKRVSTILRMSRAIKSSGSS